MTNPNTNCLEGMKCPECGSYGPFDIVGTSLFSVHDDGTDGHGDVEWDDESLTMCPTCNKVGKLQDFRDPDFEAEKGGEDG